MKLGEAMYKASQAQGGGDDAGPTAVGPMLAAPGRRTTAWSTPSSRKSTTTRSVLRDLSRLNGRAHGAG